LKNLGGKARSCQISYLVETWQYRYDSTMEEISPLSIDPNQPAGEIIPIVVTL
jgi:hypothetical protein